MQPTDYKEMLEKLFIKYQQLIDQRKEVDRELENLEQLMHALSKMLPADEEHHRLLVKWSGILRARKEKEVSLITAVRNVMQSEGRKYLTVAMVRDRLVANGFDFSEYMSNPLASVSTTLARLKQHQELDSRSIEGITAYRFRTRKRGAGLLRAARKEVEQQEESDGKGFE